MVDERPAVSPALRRLILVAAVIVILLALAWLVTMEAAHAATPAALRVVASATRSGVLISWDTPQPHALVYRRRFGAFDEFIGTSSGATLLDCTGQPGDVYLVQGWAGDGS